MEKLAYFKIENNMSAQDASDILLKAKQSGMDKVIVLHEDNADFAKTKYKEKVLSVLRAAYRHKVNIYLADDSFKYSGTGFGQLSSVKDVWQKELVIVKKTELAEDEVVLAEKGDECVVSRFMGENDDFPYSHYPDLTNPFSAEMVIDFVYAPILRDCTKFVNYELKGFACIKPLYNSQGKDAVIYSKAAIEKFKSTYKKDADLFQLFNKGAEYSKYMHLVRECVEQNYIQPLKKYCVSKKLDLIICGGEGSVSAEFCKKEKCLYLTDNTAEGKGYLMYCDKAADVTRAGIAKMGAVLKVAAGMKKMAALCSFFEQNSAEVTELEKLKKLTGDNYVITNMTQKEKSLCLLLDGEWCVLDWETGEYYDFDRKATYTFYPYSFLCLVRKKRNIYSDKLPVRVGGVLCKDITVYKDISFKNSDNIYEFNLPDEPLFGKSVGFEGDFDCLSVRLGSIEHTFITTPCVLPLFDFLSGANVKCESFGGKVVEIKIFD